MKELDDFERTYPPVGQCIYCNPAPTEGLTKEHIIPLSLAGKAILPKSSCLACAKITKDFETHCARNMFGRFRISENLPTRHAHERPTTEKINLKYGNNKTFETVNFPISMHPAVIFFPIFPMPELLRGRVFEGTMNIILVNFLNTSAQEKLDNFCQTTMCLALHTILRRSIF
jgi:hypothetical protein